MVDRKRRNRTNNLHKEGTTAINSCLNVGRGKVKQFCIDISPKNTFAICNASCLLPGGTHSFKTEGNRSLFVPTWAENTRSFVEIPSGLFLFGIIITSSGNKWFFRIRITGFSNPKNDFIRGWIKVYVKNRTNGYWHISNDLFRQLDSQVFRGERQRWQTNGIQLFGSVSDHLKQRVFYRSEFGSAKNSKRKPWRCQGQA